MPGQTAARYGPAHGLRSDQGGDGLDVLDDPGTGFLRAVGVVQEPPPGRHLVEMRGDARTQTPEPVAGMAHFLDGGQQLGIEHVWLLDGRCRLTRAVAKRERGEGDRHAADQRPAVHPLLLGSLLPRRPKRALAAQCCTGRTDEVEGREQFAQLHLGDIGAPHHSTGRHGETFREFPLAQAGRCCSGVPKRDAKPRPPTRIGVQRLEWSATIRPATTHLNASVSRPVTV
jgi:hypothetical protein